MSDYKLFDVRVKELRAIFKIGEGIPLDPSIKIKHHVNLKGGVVNENKKQGLISLSYSIYPNFGDEKKRAFELHLEIIGFYESEAEIDPDGLEKFGKAEGLTDLWLYMRSETENALRILRLPVNISIPIQPPSKTE